MVNKKIKGKKMIILLDKTKKETFAILTNENDQYRLQHFYLRYYSITPKFDGDKLKISVVVAAGQRTQTNVYYFERLDGDTYYLTEIDSNIYRY